MLIFYPKNQRGFRKGYNSQQGLVAMIEKWKKSLNSKGSFGALLADFSMAFDSIPHEFMMSKLSSSTSSMIGLIYYLVCRKGQFLDHYYLLRLFVIYFEENDIASYADDNTPYCASHDIQSTINTLQDSSVKLFDWFSKNSMKANVDECYLLLNEYTKHVACINNMQIENTT